MEHNFNFLYKQLTGTAPGEVLRQKPARPVVDVMTDLMEDNHIVLLHALLDELNTARTPAQAPAQSAIFERFQTDFNNLVIDFHKRLNEFSKLWVDRFESKNMLPTLKKFAWITQRDGRYFLSGTGDLEESINFFKFTVKDTVAEGVRIMALFDGALSRLQVKTADNWHREMLDNERKLLPLFESSMRSREMSELKDIRRALPELFRRHFCERIKNWEHKSYGSEEELYQKVLLPWYKPYHNKNGFEGYLFFVEEFVWEFIKLKMEIFEKKWRILLRGIGQKPLTEVPTQI